ncbi:MAG: amidohydrolase family protein [Pseudonocardiaceae bacterium]
MAACDAREHAPVFDVHARLGADPGAADALLSMMDRCGIARAAVCAGGVIGLEQLAVQLMTGRYSENDANNDAVLAGCARAGGRLLPFFFGNPHRGPQPYQQQAGRFRGLEISPAVHGVALTDQRTLDLVAVAAQARHPVYVVCLNRPGCGPAELAALAAAFPEVTFLLGHCGFVGIDVHSLTVIAPHRNILAETSGCYTCVARIAVARLGVERVLLGTEYPLQHPEVELAKLRALDLDEAGWQQVTWRNACRLLGESQGAPTSIGAP